MCVGGGGGGALNLKRGTCRQKDTRFNLNLGNIHTNTNVFCCF